MSQRCKRQDHRPGPGPDPGLHLHLHPRPDQSCIEQVW